jgi:hypothetical protein
LEVQYDNEEAYYTWLNLGGHLYYHPYFGRSVNPISTREQIMPTTLLHAPSLLPDFIFRPSAGSKFSYLSFVLKCF